MTMRKVAVIGVGAMGAPMARNIQAAGFDLVVCDADERATDAFVAAGASVAASPAGCGDADMIIVMVATPEQVREVLLGDGGLASGIAAGHAPLVALTGTLAPDMVCELADALRPCGARVLDAPVTGATVAARDGTLNVIVGGDADAVAQAAGVFSAIGARTYHVGPTGSAQRVKILNAIIALSNSILSAETYRLVIEHGLDLAQVTEIFEAGSGRNWFSAGAGPSALFAAMGAAQRFETALPILRKDFALALDLTRGVAGAYPGIEAMARLADEVGSETGDNYRFVARGGAPATD